MEAIRQIYDSGPDFVTIPPELRRRRLEVIILPLETPEDAPKSPTNEDVIKFFGSMPDFPERGPQGEYETRLELE
jgi:hypothetical protein